LTGKLDLRDNRSRDGITMDKIDGSSVVVMPDGSMAPRYHDGQRLLVNPDYPIKAGSAVLLELKDGSGIVRELVSKSRDEWLLKTYTPLADETIPVTEIQKAWLVIAAFEI
jgi:phage repressor protein C with HTH and peptisase S24 domain